ncbi:hypothetical protein HHI36_015885 [Cryptolaemus montrouzieri]|uniref:Major facilitator superfamily (MFS) profile domain-containing protein n=1 Tax=Cryptolaemus montrouzieri TaxID=559131 RepID=A0ABD2N6Z7_9CUCU
METWIFFSNCLGKHYTFFVAIIGNLLGFFSGISLAWSSPVLAKLKDPKEGDDPFGRPISDEEYALIGSLFSIGGAVGPIILIFSLEYLGRKPTMIILATIPIISYAQLAFSTDIYEYYVCRLALGVSVGGSFSIIAVYISEIVSSKMRGAFVSLGTSFILTGCLFSYCVGPYVSIRNFNIIIASASLLYLPIFILFCPESLYFTMQKHGREKLYII